MRTLIMAIREHIFKFLCAPFTCIDVQGTKKQISFYKFKFLGVFVAILEIWGHVEHLQTNLDVGESL